VKESVEAMPIGGRSVGMVVAEEDDDDKVSVGRIEASEEN
jgi:hypothetical protein